MKEAYWPKGLGAGICIHDDALSTQLCSDIIEFFENRPHLQSPGRTYGGMMPDVKLSMDAYVDASDGRLASDEERELVKRYEDAVLESYRAVLVDYSEALEHLNESWITRVDSGYQYQRYTQNEGFYKSHVDGAPYTNCPERVLASVMYLNTVQEGGGTHFDLFDYTCDAVVGRIVTFPCTFLHLHGGLVPESSDKSIISTFVSVPQPAHDH